MDYYAISNDGLTLTRAPLMLYPNLRRPTDDEYKAHGYYPRADEPPQPPEGECVAALRYELGADSVIHTLYVYVPIPPPPPRKWSRLSVYRALVSAGLWSRVKEMMGGDITEFLACDCLAEDDEVFGRILSAARSEFGQATVEALLDSLPVEA